MSITIVPPTRPRVLQNTDEKNKCIYTVKKANVPVTLRIHDKTTMITFRDISHATTIASSFESHYVFTKLWPDMTAESFKLTKGPFMAPLILDIFEEDFDELREYCALWNVKLLVIENLSMHNNESILFNGQLFSFDVNQKEYMDHLENIIALE